MLKLVVVTAGDDGSTTNNVPTVLPAESVVITVEVVKGIVPDTVVERANRSTTTYAVVRIPSALVKVERVVTALPVPDKMVTVLNGATTT